jgi:hypothetical protein
MLNVCKNLHYYIYTRSTPVGVCRMLRIFSRRRHRRRTGTVVFNCRRLPFVVVAILGSSVFS